MKKTVENALPFTNGKFELNQEQMGKAKAWLLEHTKTCT